MFTKPNSLEQLRELRKEYNGIIKLSASGKMSGIFPAVKQVATWIGAEDEWDVYFIAAKQYHVLLDMQMNASISVDWSMGKIKPEYKDEFGREAKIFYEKEGAIKYALS